MKVSTIGVACLAFLALSACEQNQYELGKDASGNTIRLDRRTGEMAVIKGDQIRTLKDAAQADAERKVVLTKLEEFKAWKKVDVSNVGARFHLSTSWRNGKLYYTFKALSLRDEKAADEWLSSLKDKDKNSAIPKFDPKQSDAALTKAMTHRPFTVELNDGNGFRLATIDITSPVRLVDDKGLATSYEEKGTITMSEDDYQRLTMWELKWRR